MKRDATPAGLEAQLQIAGIGRFFSAAFLGVWLVGWAAGEAFALWMLVVGMNSAASIAGPAARRCALKPRAARRS